MFGKHVQGHQLARQQTQRKQFIQKQPFGQELPVDGPFLKKLPRQIKSTLDVMKRMS
jgi:hypothetical protein